MKTGQVFRLDSSAPAFPFPVACEGGECENLTAAGPLPNLTGFPSSLLAKWALFLVHRVVLIAGRKICVKREVALSQVKLASGMGCFSSNTNCESILKI